MSNSGSELVTTVDGLVEALGGTVKVAEWAGTKHTAVSNWRSDGFIPPGWHLRLLVECWRRGVVVDTVKVFGLSPEEAAVLRDGVSRFVASAA